MTRAKSRFVIALIVAFLTLVIIGCGNGVRGSSGVDNGGSGVTAGPANPPSGGSVAASTGAGGASGAGSSGSGTSGTTGVTSGGTTAGGTGTSNGGGITTGGITGAGLTKASFVYSATGACVSGGVLNADGSISSVSDCLSIGAGATPTSIAADRHGHFVFISAEGPTLRDFSPQPVLVSFTINRSDGSLSRNPPLLTRTNPIAVDPEGKFVYMPTWSSSGGLEVFAVDEQTGELHPLQNSPFPGPNMAAVPVRQTLINRAGTRLFVINQSGYVGVWQTDPQTGSAIAVPGSPFFSGERAAFGGTLSADGRTLLIIGGKGIPAMRVNDDGSLTEFASNPLLVDPVSIVTEPSLRFVYSCEASAGPYQLDAYALDSGGRLTPLPGTPFSTGVCSAITVNPSGEYLYVTEIGGTSTYRIDSSTGVLSKVAGPARGLNGDLMVLTP